MRSALSGGGVRQAVALIAAYALALQTICASALAPRIPSLTDPVDIICHHDADGAGGAQKDQDTRHPGRGPGDHCTACAVVLAALPAPSTDVHTVEPARDATVLRPAPVLRTADIGSSPHKPRGPPATV